VTDEDEELEYQIDWETPDWSLLSDAQPAAPSLPIKSFGLAADYICSAAKGVNVPPDYPTAMLLAAVGALVGKSYQVQITTSWCEPLTLWSVIVGPPSSGKTPALRPIRSALMRLQTAVAKQHQADIEIQIEQAKANEEDEKEIAKLADQLNKPPRYVVNDSTSEALARIEARSPWGLLVERDELAGLIEGLERYSSGVDRAFYLEGFSPGEFIVDRIKAGTITIPNHCFSVMGGIQPDRLRSLLTHSGDDDGFPARLLVFWPDLMPHTGIPPGADHSSMERALERIESIKPISAEGRISLELSESAYAAMDAWYETAHGQRRGVLGKVGSAFGKLPGYAARLAGVLHILDWAFSYQSDAPSLTIEEDHMLASLDLIESYFVPQINRAYHGAELSPEEAIAGAIMFRCWEQGLDEFNLRDARREWSIPGCRAKNATSNFAAAAELLEAGEWIRSAPGNGGSTRYLVNPSLHSEE
jgi:hypothetical protein